MHSAQTLVTACPLLPSPRPPPGCRAQHIPEKLGAHSFSSPTFTVSANPRVCDLQRMLMGPMASESDFEKEQVWA